MMIVGKKIVLRDFREADVLPVLELKNEAAQQMPYNGQPFGTQSQFLAHYRKTGFWEPEEGGGRMLICGADHACIGEIRFAETSSHIQTVSYMIFKRTDYGKGYATEALGLCRDYLYRFNTGS